MLDRFLEISLASADVAASLAFYESLGFVQVPVGDAWPHAYAVVTDGRVSLGLHGVEPAPPLLTWVTPGLRERIGAMGALGLEATDVRLDDLGLNEARFDTPAGGPILRLLEARTFSPPAFDAGWRGSMLGYFESYAAAVADPAAAAPFWEAAGFVVFDSAEDRGPAVTATHRDLNLALHEPGFPGPCLVYSAGDMPARIEALRARGFRFARHLPPGYDAASSALLRAPEGTALLLAHERG